jgi:hypothetical protein
VDPNQTSPYYGRVFVGNTYIGPNGNPGDGNGILKLNADGSPADESPTNWLTTGGHQWSANNYSPWRMEVSTDDKVYINDFNDQGAIYRWDPVLSTNSQLAVLGSANWATGVQLSGPAIFGAGTNTELWMADWDDFAQPGGLLKYTVTTNGTCASNDTGHMVVGIGSGTNKLDKSPFDVALDQNHNIYTIQNLDSGGVDPRDSSSPTSSRVFRFPAYNPATNGGAPELTATWAIGTGDDTYAGASGIAVDPTGNYVAVAFLGLFTGSSYLHGNTRVFSATNGALIADLDANVSDDHVDTDCAWDAAGNVYYIHSYAAELPGVWRAISPPGANQSTTAAPETFQVTGTIQRPLITSLTVSNATVLITFTAANNDFPSLFSLQNANPITAGFNDVSGVSPTQISPGVFAFAVPSSGPLQFYRIRR